MTDSPFLTQLKARGFNGTGYKYKQNDLIGGYVFILVLDEQWTEIDFERGEVYVNKTFVSEDEANEYITSLLNEGKLEAFSSTAEMFT